jgi:hypothetical protein
LLGRNRMEGRHRSDNRNSVKPNKLGIDTFKVSFGPQSRLQMTETVNVSDHLVTDDLCNVLLT